MPALEEQLRDLVADPDRVSTGASVLDLHATDESAYPGRRPDAVVYPLTTEEVAAIVAFAGREGIAVLARGAGSGTGGKVIPVAGGICLDMTSMNQILKIRPNDFTVTLQPGVLRHTLEEKLAEYGLFFPVDPGANASVGGMVATNASGTTTLRYGSMRDNVRALQVVLADGSVARTGTRAAKSSSGYNMTALIVGSEGTLAVVTEITLRVHPILEKVVSAKAAFPDLDAATRAVVAMIGSGLDITRLELLEAAAIGVFNTHFQRSEPEAPTLFLEIGGSERLVSEELAEVEELAGAEGCFAFTAETDPTAQKQLWRARHQFGIAMAATYPGTVISATDVCVPISELPGAIRYARSLIEGRGLPAVVQGHAGDGNYHVVMGVDRDSPESIELFETLYTDLAADAVARGGTAAGEHGIGLRTGLLAQEHADLVPAMRAIKRALDPKYILNPGKTLPPAEDSVNG
jgi:D-lactate dehydrogenase (cytochrome)